MTDCKDMGRLIERLQDLLKQATTERSHFYVAKCVKESIDALEAMQKENKVLRKQKQVAVDALFAVCQSDWGIGSGIAKPAHRAIKELAALEDTLKGDNDE